MLACMVNQLSVAAKFRQLKTLYRISILLLNYAEDHAKEEDPVIYLDRLGPRAAVSETLMH